MSFAQKPLAWWSNYSSNPSSFSDALIPTIIVVLLGFVLLYTLFPKKTMDLLDAYNELPYIPEDTLTNCDLEVLLIYLL
jgi:hypothetical protein